MKKKKLTEKQLEMRKDMRELAEAIAKERGQDPDIHRQVIALIQSLDDTLSEEFVLEELKALKAGGPTFSKVFADSSPQPNPANTSQRVLLLP
jgi:hypothetical protein